MSNTVRGRSAQNTVTYRPGPLSSEEQAKIDRRKIAADLKAQGSGNWSGTDLLEAIEILLNEVFE